MRAATILLALVIGLTVVFASISAFEFQMGGSNNPTTITTTITTTYTITKTGQETITTKSTICSITGQPAGFLLRVVSDSNHIPIAGAQVTATNRPMYCDPVTPATSQTTLTFTTNNTEWYSLSHQDNAGYQLVVKYSGQSYNFTVSLGPVSETCATLYIPSGRTNITVIAFQTTCL